MEAKDEAKDEFPLALYRCPGAHKAYDGHTYSSTSAKTQAEVDQLTKKGWHKTLPDAVEAAEAKASAPPPVVVPPPPPPPKGK